MDLRFVRVRSIFHAADHLGFERLPFFQQLFNALRIDIGVAGNALCVTRLAAELALLSRSSSASNSPESARPRWGRRSDLDFGAAFCFFALLLAASFTLLWALDRLDLRDLVFLGLDFLGFVFLAAIASTFLGIESSTMALPR